MPIAISKNVTLIAEFLSLPTTNKMLSMHESYTNRTNIKFACTKGRLAPTKIDDKAARASEISPSYSIPVNLEETSPRWPEQLVLKEMNEWTPRFQLLKDAKLRLE